MRFGINTLDEFDVAGKTVLCRVDMNQPVDKATDTLKSIQRITACAPTVKELSDKGAKVVLLAHQGSDIEYKNFYSTRPHAKVLTELLGREVKWIEDVCGPTARAAIRDMRDGDVILLDNVRFCSEEPTLFELKLQLSHEQRPENRCCWPEWPRTRSSRSSSCGTAVTSRSRSFIPIRSRSKIDGSFSGKRKSIDKITIIERRKRSTWQNR